VCVRVCVQLTIVYVVSRARVWCTSAGLGAEGGVRRGVHAEAVGLVEEAVDDGEVHD
jgi:hypothetical protein